MADMKRILDAKGYTFYFIPPFASVMDALRMLDQRKVGLLLVMDGERLEGVFSERDAVRILVQSGAAALERPLHEVMSSPRHTVTLATKVDACMSLRQEGIDMELHLVGRVNPHFGRELAARVGRLRRDWPGLHHHGQMGDAALTELIAGARATVFPSIAEGCGLPLLESLWLGVPCLSSDIPSVLENAAGGGCVVVAANDLEGWRRALRSVLTDDALGVLENVDVTHYHAYA